MDTVIDLLPNIGVVAQYFTVERWVSALRALAIVALALGVAKVVQRGLSRVLEHRLAAEQRLLLVRIARYGVLGLAGTWALREMGFDVGVLLGAAGALTVALGFASQTSASNLISGLFLIVEQPFGIGDIIDVGGITGQVLSIDLLSAKLKTPDNQFVRIPNETILKSPLVNLTRFDTRQSTLYLEVDPGTDPLRLQALILAVSKAEPEVLDAPAPLAFVDELGARGLRVKIMFWSQRVRMAQARNNIITALGARMAADGIKLARPGWVEVARATS